MHPKKSWRQTVDSLCAKFPGRYTVKELCALFGVSKQAYYKRDMTVAARKIQREAIILAYIREIRLCAPGIGGMKLWFMYKRDFPDGERVGRDIFYEIIDRHGLKARHKTRRPRTTDSTHGLRVYPNLIVDYISDRCNRLWVSDITYITLWLDDDRHFFCYLSLIMDAYSREIVGWDVGATLSALHPVKALRMALKRLEGMAPEETALLIHHSDRGSQYASTEYVGLLEEKKIRISMTQNGNPKENAQAERVNGTVKNELLAGIRLTGLSDTIEAVARAVEFYNTRRPHMSIDMLTPVEAAGRTGNIRKRWHSYRDDAIKSVRDAINP